MNEGKYTYHPIEQKDDPIFTEETMSSLIELGEVIDRIRRRLVASGEYVIKNGKIEKLPAIKF